MDVTESAARHLVGVTVDGGWRVRELLPRSLDATGGNFSVGYLAEHEDGRTAFLKALDYTAELHKPNFTDRLQLLFAAYNFERDVCLKCRDARLSRVAIAISAGSIHVDGFGLLSNVPYLIFEFADGDARGHLNAAGPLDLLWKLRTLHHTAVGLRQLHANGTAHQDIKPSNVLVFKEGGSKVADLGRAADRTLTAPHDSFQIPGDRGYAPPELLYRAASAEWAVRRIGCDMYHLGSLVVFFFAGVSTTASIIAKIDSSHHYRQWGGSFDEVLPYVRQGFELTVSDFTAALRTTIQAPELASDLVTIVRQLCEPDPKLRGDPKSRGSVAAQYSLERYVSWFDRLTRRAEIILGKL
jgi:eukaryotic-like serine/threonine-protein kinase